MDIATIVKIAAKREILRIIPPWSFRTLHLLRRIAISQESSFSFFSHKISLCAFSQQLYALKQRLKPNTAIPTSAHAKTFSLHTAALHLYLRSNPRKVSPSPPELIKIKTRCAQGHAPRFDTPFTLMNNRVHHDW
jgi:hypothetical protein